ncbi:MAG: hypothetical protein RLY78_2781 [Pseudomonadota bacterium]
MTLCPAPIRACPQNAAGATARRCRMTEFLRRRPPSVLLALQGGGAHGAWTWGALDGLLAHGIRPAALSGTSAGALNAAVLASGWAQGGADGARQALADFWQALGELLPLGLLTVGQGEDTRLAPAARWMLQWATHWLSPYDTHPAELNPLRELLERHVDIQRLRHPSALPLIIATTDAGSGALHLVRNPRLDIEALLASACLPTLHHAVTLDGRTCWDGGFSANPALLPLIDAHPACDLMLIRLSPRDMGPAPREAAAIRHRMAEIGFASGLQRELQWLARLQADARAQWWPRGLAGRIHRMRWHVLDGGSALQRLAPDSRLLAHGPLLDSLRQSGHGEAGRWLQAHAAALGQRSTTPLLGL